MRRFVLLLIGVVTGCLLLSAFFKVTLEPFVSAQTITSVSRQTVEFPIYLSDALCAVRLTAYDGPFLEDGTDDEVIGVAALELMNTSSQMIERGRIILRCADQVLHFDFTDLPAGERLLALEEYRCYYARDVVFDCEMDLRYAAEPSTDRLLARIETPGYICVENSSEKAYEGVKVHYKTYNEQSDMYIGGVTYTAYVGRMEAGSKISVTPYHVAKGYTQIVKITHE